MDERLDDSSQGSLDLELEKIELTKFFIMFDDPFAVRRLMGNGKVGFLFVQGVWVEAQDRLEAIRLVEDSLGDKVSKYVDREIKDDKEWPKHGIVK